MKLVKLALIGSAALVAVSVSARADDLNALKAQIDSLSLNAAADVPVAAPATTVTWTGFVRGAVVTAYSAGATAYVGYPTAPILTNAAYATDIRAYGEIKVTATTQTAVGEVGVAYQIQSGGGYGFSAGGAGVGMIGGYGNNANGNTFGGTNGNGGGYVTTDGISGWWKMTPNMTLSAGFLGNLSKSGYSWDAICTCDYTSSGGGVIAGPYNNDPAAIQLAYADGPLGFAIQVEDGNNYNNASAFGVTAKAKYKMDAFGIDLNGGYWGNANGPAAWSVSGGAGYSAGAFGIGMALGTGSFNNVTKTPGSAYAKIGLSDQANFQIGATHDFASGGFGTNVGAGIYYTPVKQLMIGAEGGYAWDNGGNNTGYSAALITQFSF